MPPRILAGAPDQPVAIPTAVARLAGGADLTPVWRNALGGLTFSASARAAHPRSPARFIKWCPSGVSEIDLGAEAQRIEWAAQHGAAVPRVLDQGDDADGSWLVTEAIAAESAVADRWRARPETAALAIGAGLRRLHDAVPVAECPYSWSVEDRLAAAGDVDPAALAKLGAPPPIDAVVCHGDACAPNTLLDGDGAFAAHVDLGALGVADRWADLAVAAWSTEWNYGAGYEHLVYEGYGVEPDPPRIAYYRLLWDLS